MGLALSDPSRRIAQPLGALRCKGPRRDLVELRRIVHEHDVARVVVGLPLTMAGAEGRAAVAARAFAGSLRTALVGLDVELWDERLTTVEAERLLAEAQVKRKRRREVVDSLAAMLILQGFLEAGPEPRPTR